MSPDRSAFSKRPEGPEKDTPAFRRFQTDIIYTAEVAVRVVVNFVRRTRRIDVGPGLQIEPQIRHEVLRFTDSLTDLHNAQAEILEFRQGLNIIRALPALDVGVGDPLGF